MLGPLKGTSFVLEKKGFFGTRETRRPLSPILKKKNSWGKKKLTQTWGAGGKGTHAGGRMRGGEKILWGKKNCRSRKKEAVYRS